MTPGAHRLGPLAAGQPRAALVAEVTDALSGLRQGARAIVACSGGPDSTVLAHLTAEARPDLDLTVGHVRHGLRDDRIDLQLVRQHADWLGLDVEVREVEPTQDGHGLEAAAREARYRALREIAEQRDAKAILVGHTADDQAETVLLRLARGTGIDGLAAMEPVADDIVRPMLRIRRIDVQRFVVLEGLPIAEDPMNDDPRVRRTVVRHELLAVLDRVAPDPVGALTRLADLARDDSTVLEVLAREQLAHVRLVGPIRAVADAVLEEAPTAIARRIVRSMVAEVAGGMPDADTVVRALTLESGSAVSLPGPIEVTAAAGWRAIAPRSMPSSSPLDLPVPGVVVWKPASLTVQAITAETDPWRARSGTSVGEGQVALALPDAWSPPPPDVQLTRLPPGGRRERMVLSLPAGLQGLTVRHRRTGDRVHTPGGTRRLQDVFVDAGVPRPVREVWPVIVDGDGAVIWVPGVTADEDVLHAGRARPAAQLRITSGATRNTR